MFSETALERRKKLKEGIAKIFKNQKEHDPSNMDEARELARLFRGVALRVSVIDVNDPTGTHPRAPAPERGRFLSALSENGIGFMRRYSGGADIHAACGMLASRTRGGEPHRPSAGPA